jgi:hypothetical protein
LRVRGPPGCLLAEEPALVLGVVQAFSFPFLFQVRSAKLAPVLASTFHAVAIYVALRDMPILARPTGEVVLQAERFGLIAADDVRGFDSH